MIEYSLNPLTAVPLVLSDSRAPHTPGFNRLVSCVYSSSFSEHQVLLTRCEITNYVILNAQDVLF